MAKPQSNLDAGSQPPPAPVGNKVARDSNRSVDDDSPRLVNWQIADGAGAFNPAEVDWFALERCPGARRVKTGDGRSTWRVEAAGRLFFVKVYERSGESRWSRLAARWRRSFAAGALRVHPGAAREWVVFRRARSESIPMVRALALGTEPATGRSVLITEGLADARALAETWLARRAVDLGNVVPNLGARPLIRAVASLLATTHDRGFVHCDGHARNILIHASGLGDWIGVFADPHPVRFGKRAARPMEAARSLAQLDQFFQHAATRTQRLRFLREYLFRRARGGAMPETTPPLPWWVTAAARHRERAAARLAAHRDRRLRRAQGTYFARLALPGGWRGMVACRIGRRHLFPESDVPDRSPEQWRELLQGLALDGQADRAPVDSRRTQGVLALRLSARGVIRRWSWTVQGSPARRAFIRSHRLRHRDRPAELILGYLERRRFGLLDDAVLLRVDRSSS